MLKETALLVKYGFPYHMYVLVYVSHQTYGPGEDKNAKPEDKQLHRGADV